MIAPLSRVPAVEPLSILDHCLVELALPRHQELQHHKIRQQDVGLGLSDALALLGVLLPGIPSEGRPQVFRQAGLVEKFVEFLALAVGERVHRIDHDRPRAAHFAGARARITASMIGMKKQSDFPEPVPVVTAKLCRAIAFATACI